MSSLVYKGEKRWCNSVLKIDLWKLFILVVDSTSLLLLPPLLLFTPLIIVFFFNRRIPICTLYTNLILEPGLEWIYNYQILGIHHCVVHWGRPIYLFVHIARDKKRIAHDDGKWQKRVSNTEELKEVLPKDNPNMRIFANRHQWDDTT